MGAGIAALLTDKPTLERTVGYAFTGALAGAGIGEIEHALRNRPSKEGADYVADLLTRVIHVSTESDKIIKSLPNALNTTLITLE